ncbi:MAG: pilus assembly protein [Parahaliea sp.]
MNRPVLADDIARHFPFQARGQVYLLLHLDMGPGMYESVCHNLDECALRMSAPAYRQLVSRHSATGRTSVTRFDILRALLIVLIDEPQLANIQLAIAVSNRELGSRMIAGYRQLGSQGQELIDRIDALPSSLVFGTYHFNPALAYYEWFRYVTGDAVLYGQPQRTHPVSPENPANDQSIVAGGRYRSPSNWRDSCPYFVSLMATFRESASSVPDTAARMLALEPQFPGRFHTNEVQFLQHLHDRRLDLLPALMGSQTFQRSWVVGDGNVRHRALARAGRVPELPAIDEPLALENALREGLLQAVNQSIHTQSLLSTSVSNDVVYHNDQLFMSLYRADNSQRWQGNLKKLRIDPNAAGSYSAVDARDAPALVETGLRRGQLAEQALTFWTPSADIMLRAQGFGISTQSDGPVVDLGGAGQRIPGLDEIGEVGEYNAPNHRRLYVEPDSVRNGQQNILPALDVNPVLLADHPGLLEALDVADVASALDLIAWLRGLDVDDEDGDGERAEARGWLLGELLHSRPLPVNYGAVAGYSESNPLVRLFVGSGDGLLHAIENTDVQGRESGRELWAFAPRETLSVAKARRHQLDSARYKRYGVDGSAVVRLTDLNQDAAIDHRQGDEAWLYFGLRRGGAAYYALDISQPLSAPLLRWTISSQRQGFEELALSFSTPVVGKVQFEQQARDVLIFAAGYYGGWTPDYTGRIGKDAGRGRDLKGNAIYIVDANTGALIWKAVHGPTGERSERHYAHADMVHSIPSQPAVMRNDAGIIHRLYVGDSGGGLWRVDLPPGNAVQQRREHWFVSKIADLAEASAEGDLRFFHAPDLLRSKNSAGRAFDGLLIASGNRADPLEQQVKNQLFYIRDYHIVSGDRQVQSRPVLQPEDLDSAGHCGLAADACQPGTGNGWRLAFLQPGEKALSSPLAENGKVYLSTYMPPTESADCGGGSGHSQLYVLQLGSGEAVYQQAFFDLGAGMAPGPLLTPRGIWLPAVDDLPAPEDSAGPFIPLRGALRFRLYWREPGVDKI